MMCAPASYPPCFCDVKLTTCILDCSISEMEWTFGDGEQKEGPPDIRSENGIGGLGASAADAAMDMLMPPPVDEYTNPLGNRQSSPTLSESQTGGLGEIDPAAGSIDDV